MTKLIRCGRCGQKGNHNQRTCGKFAPQQPLFLSNSGETFPVSIKLDDADVMKPHAMAMIIRMANLSDPTGGGHFTAEEMEVWWTLYSPAGSEEQPKRVNRMRQPVNREQEKLCESFDSFLRMIPSTIPNSVMIDFLNQRPPALQERYLGQPSCPTEIKNFFAERGTFTVRKMLASDSCSDADTLTILADDIYPQVRRLVAKNSRTAEKNIVVLASDEDNDTKMIVAKRETLSEATFNILATDTNPAVRGWIAGREDCPESVAYLLAGDDNLRVRETIATRKTLSARIRETLSGDSSPKVKKRIIMNFSTTAEEVKSFLNDSEKIVRLTAQNRLKSMRNRADV